MSERNGKNKIHNIINKAMKGVVVFALFLFIIFVLKNKAEFSEKIAKGGPDKEISQVMMRLCRSLKRRMITFRASRS